MQAWKAVPFGKQLENAIGRIDEARAVPLAGVGWRVVRKDQKRQRLVFLAGNLDHLLPRPQEGNPFDIDRRGKIRE